jgi:hypothetical protein
MAEITLTPRESTFLGLAELNIDPYTVCTLCSIPFNSTNTLNDVSLSNRLYACGCTGSNNQHIFHERCLEKHSTQCLKNQHKNYMLPRWDKADIPCPTCGLPIKQLNLIYPNMRDRPSLGGTRRRRRLKRSRRYK